jgi:hypothetical protein
LKARWRALLKAPNRAVALKRNTVGFTRRDAGDLLETRNAHRGGVEVECAVAAQAAFLVTGNTKHFESLKSFQGVQIVTPRQFLDLLRPADSG